ncbi:MAG: molybdate transport system ATP-binding protein [Fusobacteria bacterium]|nr:MAG: molybdate transport system ATP-binding protein [Fusobacteriota bacterium]KAF0229807.1 MAG: molybdate transport system ATP-binding [Fusobacteriota bacterium]
MIDILLNKKIGNNTYNYKLKTNSKIIAIMGQSGAGKTTFLRLLSGLLKPDSGYIKINNFVMYDNDKVNIKTKLRQIAYIFQHDNLFPHLNVAENIGLGLNVNQVENIIFWLEKFGLGYIRNSKITNLSGGEKQRIALIRALLHNPRLLLLDEAFSSLDEENKNILYNEIKSVLHSYKGHTIIVTHDYKEAMKLADEIFYLSDNKFNKVWNNYIEGEIKSIEEKDSGDIFSISSGNLLLRGIILKDFIKVGDIIKVEIESVKVKIGNMTYNEENFVDNNLLKGIVVKRIDNVYELSVDDKIIYARSDITYELNSQVNIFIKYKNVNIVK